MRIVGPLLVSILVVTPARAESEPVRRFDVAASVGYAFPLGSSERGARLSDATFGNAPIDLAAAYRLSERLALLLSGRYGAVVPTLCTDTSDCISSLGHDVILTLRARIFLPRLLGADPYGDVGFGYEWFVSKLADSGATSTHSYDGPILVSTELGMPFEVGRRWTFGPALGLGLGTFIGSRLEAPGIAQEESVSDRSIHAWLSLVVRTSVRF
jgi:hypothetical protein